MGRQAIVKCVLRTAAATQVVMAEDSDPVEPEQQDYDQNNPVHDAHHRGGCSRPARLHQLGGDQARQSEGCVGWRQTWPIR